MDHITPKKIQLFEDCRKDTADARIFVILVRHKQFQMVSFENRITEI